MIDETMAQLDGLIDAAAEAPYASVVAGIDPRERDELTVRVVDRLFERRLNEYADAAARTPDHADPESGLDALASLFPTPVWEAYWSIIFGTRTNEAVRSQLVLVTDRWEQEIMHWFPQFFPRGTEPSVIDLIAVQVDALALLTTELGGSYDREAHVRDMTCFLTTGRLDLPTARLRSGRPEAIAPAGASKALIESAMRIILAEGGHALTLEAVRGSIGSGSLSVDGSPPSTDEVIRITLGGLLEAQADATSSLATSVSDGNQRARLGALAGLFVRGAAPSPEWLCYHELLFAQRSGPNWSSLQETAERSRPALEAAQRDVIAQSVEDDGSLDFVIRHLNGLALWSLFVPDEEALAISANLDALASILDPSHSSTT